MSESEMDDNVVPHTRVRSLREAVQKARHAEAVRDDAIEERRETETTRLDLLLDDLKPIVADIPAGDERFVFTISRGETPRLWIDATTHVVIARDARTYRLLSDTRLGRVVLAESEDLEQVSDRITAHVAERMIERERAIEGDWRIQRLNERAAEDAKKAAEERERAKAEAENPTKPPRGERDGSLLGLFLGLILGAAALAIYLHASGTVDMLKVFHLPIGKSVEETTGTAPAATPETAAPETTAPETASGDESTTDGAPAEPAASAEPAAPSSADETPASGTGTQ